MRFEITNHGDYGNLGALKLGDFIDCRLIEKASYATQDEAFAIAEAAAGDRIGIEDRLDEFLVRHPEFKTPAHHAKMAEAEALSDLYWAVNGLAHRDRMANGGRKRYRTADEGEILVHDDRLIPALTDHLRNVKAFGPMIEELGFRQFMDWPRLKEAMRLNGEIVPFPVKDQTYWAIAR